MEFTIYKLLVPLFAVCMIAKAVSRFRRHQRTVRELVVWIIIWSGISFAALFPDFTMDWFSVLTGIKSGFYAIIFFMLVLLSYGYLTSVRQTGRHGAHAHRTGAQTCPA